MLAMDMDKIFDSAPITPTNQEKDMETVKAASSETISPSSRAAQRPRQKTPTRTPKHTTIAEEVAEDTDSKSSITSTSRVSLSQSDFSSSSSTAEYQRQHCTRKKESMVDKAATKDTNNTIKEDYDIAETNGPIPCTISPLPRLKTSKPNRVLIINMS